VPGRTTFRAVGIVVDGPEDAPDTQSSVGPPSRATLSRPCHVNAMSTCHTKQHPNGPNPLGPVSPPDLPVRERTQPRPTAPGRLRSRCSFDTASASGRDVHIGGQPPQGRTPSHGAAGRCRSASEDGSRPLFRAHASMSGQSHAAAPLTVPFGGGRRSRAFQVATRRRSTPSLWAISCTPTGSVQLDRTLLAWRLT